MAENHVDSSGKSRVTLTEPPILVMQTAFLGDLLLCIPLLRRLRQLRPGAALFLVARAGVGRLMKDLELVDYVFEVQKGDRESYAKALKALREFEFEWILCPHQSFNSAQFCWRIQADLKISYRQWWNGLFFKDRITKDMRLPEALRQLSLVSHLDEELKKWIDESLQQDLRLADAYGRMPAVPVWASMSLREKLRNREAPREVDRKTVCIFPGSVWATKQWTEDGFTDVAKRLTETGHRVYWMGSKDELPLARQLEARVPGSQALAGQLSLYQSLVLLSRAGLSISNDSAGGHLTAVAGTPGVSIFGPTVLRQGFRPWNSQALVAELFDVACRPCGAHGHRRCPRGTHECMKRLPSALVWQRVQQILQARQG